MKTAKREGAELAALGTAGLLACAFLGVILAGCAQNVSYLELCRPGSLEGEQLQAFSAQISRIGPSSQPVEMGRDTWWLPFVHLRYAVNELNQGSAVTIGDPGLVEKSATQEWVKATKFRAAGPLAVPWFCMEYSFFDNDGTNFGYYRTNAVVWGFLWTDQYSETPEDGGTRKHAAGLLLTAFGYGSRETREGRVTTIRFLWIPIPISRS